MAECNVCFKEIAEGEAYITPCERVCHVDCVYHADCPKAHLAVCFKPIQKEQECKDGCAKCPDECPEACKDECAEGESDKCEA